MLKDKVMEVKNKFSVGMQVVSQREFGFGADKVRVGSHGYIVGDDGYCWVVAWDLPQMPYPKDCEYVVIANMQSSNPRCPRRDHYDYETAATTLEPVNTRRPNKGKVNNPNKRLRVA